jgi:hypothetical protein
VKTVGLEGFNNLSTIISSTRGTSDIPKAFDSMVGKFQERLKIEKKEAELKEGTKNKMLQAERSQLERSIQNLKELKDKVSNSQDKLAHGADK